MPLLYRSLGFLLEDACEPEDECGIAKHERSSVGSARRAAVGSLPCAAKIPSKKCKSAKGSRTPEDDGEDDVIEECVGEKGALAEVHFENLGPCDENSHSSQDDANHPGVLPRQCDAVHA